MGVGFARHGRSPVENRGKPGEATKFRESHPRFQKPNGGRGVCTFMAWFREFIGPDQGADAQQLCMRAILLFIFGIICIRIAGRRTFAQYSPLDIIVALIVGSNISRIMTGKADVIPAGAATLVLVLLHRILAMATLRWGALAWLVKARPVRLVRDGQIDAKALRRANLSDDDLHEAIRMEQFEDPADLRLAMLEGSGKVSVVPKRHK
jgi:uncharacterized membrane protein YcaP (DUF421 family)